MIPSDASRLESRLPFPIVQAGEESLVIDKPAGLPVHSGMEGRDVMGEFARAGWNPVPQPVHRLDAATSGCLLLACGRRALRRLAGEFAARRVRKSYVAWVRGCPWQEHGEVFTHLASSGVSGKMAVVEPGAGPVALTLYRVLFREDGRSLVCLEPVTGRTHQLRAHMRHLGHPILGDPLYAFPDCPQARRLMLHAYALGFSSPREGWRKAFAPVPGDFPLPGGLDGKEFPGIRRGFKA